ncbi:MAG: site-2 protease family protein [Candidatus Roizmanbacteria bacterium]|nr:site-2 protease family protein [Candidatus Roizmanbacteria bacterium]
MLNLLIQSPLVFLLVGLIMVVSIAVHEFSHALAADRLGDPTPRAQGRLTLNPLSHLDPLGMVLLLTIGFGWGKPVQYDPYNLTNHKRDSALIALAGPVSSILLACLAALGVYLLQGNSASIILEYVVGLNVMLAVFNLLPIHPLDGFRVVAGLVPDDSYEDWIALERYGVIFLLFLFIPIQGTSLLSLIIRPVIGFITSLLIPNQGMLI